MAVFRKIHTSFWQDPFVLSLTPEQKMFYLYLLTNEKTTACGIYEVSKQLIKLETSLTLKTIDELLVFFESNNKIVTNKKTFEICIVNWFKYNSNLSPSTVTATKKTFEQIKDTTLITYLHSVPIAYTQCDHSVDTTSNHFQKGLGENEKEKEKEKEKERENEKEELTPVISENERILLQSEFGLKNANKYIAKVIWQITNNNKSYKNIYDTAKLWLLEDDYKIIDIKKQSEELKKGEKQKEELKNQKDAELAERWKNMTDEEKEKLKRQYPGMMSFIDDKGA